MIEWRIFFNLNSCRLQSESVTERTERTEHIIYYALDTDILVAIRNLNVNLNSHTITKAI